MKANDDGIKKLAEKFKLKDKGIPYSQFKKGIKVEMEHGPKNKGGISKETNVTGGSLAKTAKIALAHLIEDNRYYFALRTMEKSLEKSKQSKKVSSKAMPKRRKN